MSDGWDLSVGGNKTGNKKAEFTTFPVGITRVRVIDEAPMMRWTHWWPAAKRSINCPGKSCPVCEIRRMAKANKQPQVHNMSRRYAINIINRETNRAEIMEQGVGFFEDLRDIRADLVTKGNDLRDVDLKVKRRGTNQEDTSYRIDVDGEPFVLTLSDEALAVDKMNLEEYFKPHLPEQVLRLLNGEAWEKVFASQQDAPTSPADDEIVLG